MEIVFCGYLKRIFKSDGMTYQIDYNNMIFVDDFKSILAQLKNIETDILSDTLFMQSEKILHGRDKINVKEKLYILPPILGG